MWQDPCRPGGTTRSPTRSTPGFADGDGDGEGDLPGLTNRLPYLADLGVDAIWVAPWYPSPLAYGGYDVTDYRDIHPLYGTLADAEGLVAAAHETVSASSSTWSPTTPRPSTPGSPRRRSTQARRSATDTYSATDGEPTATGRRTTGSVPSAAAWSRTGDADAPGQWYLHTFAPEQPDLDWTDTDVSRSSTTS